MWERVTSPVAADFNRRQDYLPPEEPAYASGDVEDAIHDEWKAHIAPSEAIIGVEAAAREYHQQGVLDGCRPSCRHQPAVRTRTMGRQAVSAGIISEQCWEGI
jgi:hypothetical protein